MIIEFLNGSIFGYLLHAFEIAVSEAVLGVCFKRRKLFVLRACLAIVAYLGLSLGFGLLFEKFFPYLSYLIAFFLSFALYPICFKVNVWDELYCCIAAIAIQNLSYSVSGLFVAFFGYDPVVISLVPSLIQTVIYIGMQFGCFVIVLKKLRGSDGGFGAERVAMIVLSIILTAVVYGVQYDKQALSITDFYLWRIVFISYDVLLLFMLFGMYERTRLRRENAILDQLRENEARQYELDKRAIEMVNIKCHDLKHRLIALRGMAGAEQERALSDVEDAVMLYDSIAKTGCKALDVILSNKCLLCEKYGIRLTYIVDGKKLGFMKSVDIYSLFGNAIDNAIRAVKDESDPEKRIINISVTAREKLLSVHIENYCGKAPTFRNGLPVTTHNDTELHGFGMISMKRIVEGYDGVMSVEYKYPLFLLDCTIPISDTVSENPTD